MKKRLIRKRSGRMFEKWGFRIFILTVSIAVVLIGFITFHIMKAPDVSEINIAPEGYVSTIYDRDNKLLKQLSVTESNRIYVTLSDIPQDLQNAFIAIEDKRFYEHEGIDIKGILRAAWLGIKNNFQFSQGASTITQQLLKNNVFTEWMGEKNLYDRISRKIQEQYLAVKVENEYSKEWILENYLNTINLGNGTRGVQVAAQYYYGKNVSELTLAQCALIAGITKNPSAYDPVTNPEKSVERQQIVLKEMCDQGYITKQEYEDAALENVISKMNKNPTDNRLQVFSWFEEAMLKQIVEDLTTEYTYSKDEAWNLIYSGGLKIYSTLEPYLQEICEEVAENDSWYNTDEEVSIVMNDVSTGAVVAIVGGREEKNSNLIYNRATDFIRQPGSTIKIIGEYATALDTKELSLGSVVDDEPYYYSDGTSIHNSYSSYKGKTTIRDAIAVSSNVVALKTFQTMGEKNVFEYLQKFGITTLTEEDINEALSIGGTYNGVTNLELTAAYNAIANRGSYIEPFYYTTVVDMNGKVLLERGTNRQQVISKETAYLLTSAMEDVITSGTGKAAAVDNITLAGKSGTTNNNKDVWFVGFSSYYTCGVWGGNDDYSEQKSGNYVKLIWQKIMEESHEDKDDYPLIDTSDLVTVNICKKCGKTAVADLCDQTVQGDMTIQEYYISGTEPTETCNCHESVTICQESGKIAGKYCPNDSKITMAYLKTASKGTIDENCTVLEIENKKCDIHKDFLDYLKTSTEESSEEDDESKKESSEEEKEEKNWFENMIKHIFDGQ